MILLQGDLSIRFTRKGIATSFCSYPCSYYRYKQNGRKQCRLLKPGYAKNIRIINVQQDIFTTFGHELDCLSKKYK